MTTLNKKFYQVRLNYEYLFGKKYIFRENYTVSRNSWKTVQAVEE